MKRLFLVLSILSALSLPLNAQHANVAQSYDPGSVTRDHNLNFVRMRLSVEFVPEKGLVIGNITHHFSPIRDEVDSFFLDGPGIQVKSATLNGKPVNYKTTADGIRLYTGVAL